MKNKTLLFLAILILLVSFKVSAQETATIKIKIENRPYIQVQSYSFFRKPNVFTVKKIDPKNYIVNYFSKAPSLLYINLKPVYISPGDSISLTYSLLDENPNSIKDTLILTGNNIGNYRLSSYIDKRPKGFYPDFGLEKDRKHVFSIYRQQKGKYDVYKKYVFDQLTRENASREIVDFFSRDIEIDFIIELLNYEEILVKSKHKQLKPFSNLIDSIFMSTTFLASDTVYRYGMERLFRQYFSRQLDLKFNNLREKIDYDKIVSYVAQYPNEFIKDYFVYFLLTDFQSLLANYPSDDLYDLTIKNPHFGKTLFDPYVDIGVY